MRPYVSSGSSVAADERLGLSQTSLHSQSDHSDPGYIPSSPHEGSCVSRPLRLRDRQSHQFEQFREYHASATREQRRQAKTNQITITSSNDTAIVRDLDFGINTNEVDPIVNRAHCSDHDAPSPPSLEEDRDVNKFARPFKPIFLSAEQQAVLRMIVDDRQSMFFTGAAGTGKSVLLRRVISDLRQRLGNNVAVTASTGIAACNIGGSTLHSFAGIGLGILSAEQLLKDVRKRRQTMLRWKRTKVLIIDEISMIHAPLLDKLNYIAQNIRGSREPFGGIQVVLTGDFFQLPPVSKDRDVGGAADRQYAFKAECWSELVPQTFLLTHVFRQQDQTFANTLNEMRIGKLSPETIALFKSRDRPLELPDNIQPTKLFPLRFDADRANQKALDQLPGETNKYTAADEQNGKGFPVDLGNLMAAESLSLKVGAQVMMIKNIDANLVNGSLGRVIGFMSTGALGRRRLGKDDPEEERIETSQDAEMEEFTNRALGIANEIEVVSAQPTALGQRKRQRLNALKQMNQEDDSKAYPLVRFTRQDGTFRDMLVLPETWDVLDAEGEVLASRTQVPLILAWAISIHKSQGQTLEYVNVNLRSVFEVGQAYVAISRATSLEGLQIIGFDERKVFVDSSVVEFYSSLGLVGTQPEEVHQKDIDDLTSSQLSPKTRAEHTDAKENYIVDVDGLVDIKGSNHDAQPGKSSGLLSTSGSVLGTNLGRPPDRSVGDFLTRSVSTYACVPKERSSQSLDFIKLDITQPSLELSSYFGPSQSQIAPSSSSARITVGKPGTSSQEQTRISDDDFANPLLESMTNVPYSRVKLQGL